MSNQEGNMKPVFIGRALGAALIVGLSLSSAAYAQGSGAGGRGGFTEQGGEAIFKNVCQGCHMPQAQGAVGAGMYPALAKNPKLEVAGYPIAVIVN
ncbi:MAG: cytochrome c, partial [Alphaproteobacteria bacterium]|nr:cytochrome c [Alphaproteobacteria bacterium]